MKRFALLVTLCLVLAACSSAKEKQAASPTQAPLDALVSTVIASVGTARGEQLTIDFQHQSEVDCQSLSQLVRQVDQMVKAYLTQHPEIEATPVLSWEGSQCQD